MATIQHGIAPLIHPHKIQKLTMSTDLPLDIFKAPLSSSESSVIDSCSCCFNFSMTVSGTRSTFLSHDVEKLVKKEVILARFGRKELSRQTWRYSWLQVFSKRQKNTENSLFQRDVTLLQPLEMRHDSRCQTWSHKIGTYMYAISKCAFLLGFRLEIQVCFKRKVKKSIDVSVERGVATKRAQMVWPMIIVTVTNFEGFIKNLQKCSIFQNYCLVRPSKFVTVTVMHHRPHYLSPFVATPFHTPSNRLLDNFLKKEFRT